MSHQPHLTSNQEFTMFNILQKTALATVTTLTVLIGESTSPVATQTLPSPQLEAMTLQHVAIRVTDFENTVAWYKEKFNAQELTRWDAPPYIDPDLKFAYLEFNGIVLEVAGGGRPVSIQPEPTTMQEDYTRAGYAHICFEVKDAEAAMAELRQRGIEIYAGPFTNPTLNRTFFHIKDPAGTWIEFVEIHDN